MNLKKNEVLLYERQIPIAFWVAQALMGTTVILTPRAIWGVLQILTAKGYVTNERISVKWGVLGGTELDATYDKIASVSSTQSMLGKIFNYGFVVITNSGAEKFLFFTAAPQKVKSLIFDAQEKYKEQQMNKQAQSMAQAMKAS